jgi:putative ATP-binding cassette transporter
MSMSFIHVFGAIWRLSKGFWSGKTAPLAWTLTIGAFGLALVEVLMQVLLNRWTKLFFDAIEKRAVDQLTQAAYLFAGLLVAITLAVVCSLLARLFLQIHWRRHLTRQLTEQWLSNQAFYRLNIMRGADFAPEARIAEDARLAVEPIVDLVIGFMSAVVTFAAFVGILWQVGGSLTLGGVTIPGYMVWAAIAYSLIVSLFMITIGRSYAERIRQRSEAEAQFRYELTRVRENAESIALVRGEEGERTTLGTRFGRVVEAWRQYALRWGYMTIVVNTSALAAPIVPVLLMAPSYLGDTSMTFGTVMQAAAAFGTVQASLAWVTANFARISEWFASASRLAELSAYVQASSAPDEAQTRIEIKQSPDDKLRLENVAVKLHNGRALIADAQFSIEPGEMVMVTGKSGTGKSTLIRAIAGLWPWGSGTILLPKDADIAFVPQRPYMPLGTLKAAVTYPKPPEEVPDAAVVEALTKCDLAALAERLHEKESWDRLLSGGELQRVSFARLLIQKPSLVILDEATSALDEGNQARLMELFKTDLYEASVISVAHRVTLKRYHGRQITLRKKSTGARAVDRLRALTDWSRIRNAMRRPKRSTTE